MSTGRIVPWCSWEEWNRVFKDLLSENPSDQTAAVNKVSSWRLRGAVPLAIDVSGALIDTMLHDRLYQEQHGRPQSERLQNLPDGMLRLQYSLCIIRLVNGITDTLQKGRIAASVANLADGAGLPRILVDIRHLATHNELPALPLLRLGASHAVSWLRSHYWESQQQHLQSCREHIAQLLSAYMQSCMAAVHKQVAMKPGDDDGDEVAASVDDQSGSSYVGADGKRQRRQILGELRDLVPAPWAQELAGVMLTGRLLEPPFQGQPPLGSPAKAPGAEQAWSRCIQAMTLQYPSLPPLLLRGAVERVCTAIAAEANDAASWLRWAQRLLGTPSPTRGRAAPSPKSGRDQDPSAVALVAWEASEDQLRELLAMTISAQARLLAAAGVAPPAAATAPGAGAGSSAHASATGTSAMAVDGSGGVGGSSQPQTAAGVGGGALGQLRELTGLLAAHLSTQASSPASRLLCKLAEQGAQVGIVGPASHQVVDAGDRQFEPPSPGPGRDVHQWTPHKRVASVVGSTQQGTDQRREDAVEGTAKRWRRQEQWQPCALGLLPCLFDSNGRLPDLAGGSTAQGDRAGVAVPPTHDTTAGNLSGASAGAGALSLPEPASLLQTASLGNTAVAVADTSGLDKTGSRSEDPIEDAVCHDVPCESEEEGPDPFARFAGEGCVEAEAAGTSPSSMDVTGGLEQPDTTNTQALLTHNLAQLRSSIRLL